MKTLLSAICFISVATTFCRAGSAEDKAFTDKYKAAFESKDTKTLESFLYTTGSDAGALQFYKMMLTAEAGSKIASIELVALTPEQMKKAGEPQEGPGGKMCLTLKPTKNLLIKVEHKDDNGSSTSSSTSFVAEKDGKLVIPVPGPCK
ncbi:MAG TPA: hypothetical protein VLK27_07790 [Chthoniobacterales bacterium]|nr:hypothetical protein [Chthoniobacterales bacterium]